MIGVWGEVHIDTTDGHDASPDGPTTAAPTRSPEEPPSTGSFEWNLDSDVWRWSPTVAAMFGHGPGVPPTSELISLHRCDDDACLIADLLNHQRRGDAAFFSSYRPITTTTGARRILLATGILARSPAGESVARGQMSDLTRQHHRATREAVRSATRTRDRISRAVGMIMVAHDVDADAGFALLVSRSQARNRRLALLAQFVVEQWPRTDPRLPARERMDRLLSSGPAETLEP